MPLNWKVYIPLDGALLYFLTPAAFFSLQDYAHRALFEGASFVWEPLAQIDLYLSTLSLGKIDCPIPHTVHLVNPHLISIGRGSHIEPGAFIQGPCILGEESTVRHGAYIRGGVIAGDRCVIGHSSEVKHSILLNGVKVPHFNYVGDSILGNEVNLGAGVKCANYRLDGRPVAIRFEGGWVETHMNKLGAIVGDRAQIGCNCVTSPGTLIGCEALSHPCLHIFGWVAAASVLKQSSKNEREQSADR